jgi:uncharacterized protein (DUF1697 family)
MSSYCLALLRGINVGGSNLIRMSDLKVCFEDIGCADVATYIASGNVLFRSDDRPSAKLVSRIERALSARFEYASRVVVLTHAQLAQVVERAPKVFGKAPDKYRYDVVFLKQPLTETEAMKSVSLKPGVDAAWKGKGVLYFSRLTSKAAQSHLSKLLVLPVYKQMTIRNWNTTTKLLALMDKAEAQER